jgi:replicative DNA helicase
MNKKILYSIKLEQHIISGLLKHPNCFFQISQFLTSDDFGDPSKVNPTIFNIIQNSILSSEPIDPVLLSQKASALKINFEDGINIFDYLQSLSMRSVSEEACISAAKQVKKYSIRRSIINNSEKLKKEILDLDDSASFDEIVSLSDKIYNNDINIYFNNINKPQNIFDDMEQNIELRGENPLNDVGIMTHFPRVNELFGSLLRPGNITVIASRYGVGKSTLALDVCSKAGISQNIPVLHFDNGEMSYEEIQNRMCASMTGIPLYYIESGKWRQNPKSTEKVRKLWKDIKNWKFYYYNVGGINYDEMINTARRWYYSEVKRGNKMIWSFDYIKLISLGGQMDKFWAEIGIMLDKIKTFISKEIVYENQPQICLLTSVQANRTGISQNRNASDIDDSEAVIGLSDMIGQIASHLFILRKKTTDEIITDGQYFGTHKLIHLKSRHMGVNPNRAFDLVCMPDGSKKKNHINLDFNNFSVKEKGDLIDWCNHLHIDNASPIEDGSNE